MPYTKKSRRYPGRPPKKAMRLAQEVWNKNGTNGIDGRTRFGKDFGDAQYGYYAERGLLTEQGEIDHPSAGQTVSDLIDLASYLKADVKRRYANYVKCDLQRRSSGDLHPCPQCEKALYTPVNTLSRTLTQLFSVSPPRRSERSLEEYLQARKQSGANGGSPSTAPLQPEPPSAATEHPPTEAA